MKKSGITCQVIQDILPLYTDGCCSEDSKNLVEEHLKTCDDCRKLVDRYEEPVPVQEEKEVEVTTIRRSMRQIRRGKTAGVVALVLVFAVFFVAIPLKNYIVGDGITYANLKEISDACSFGDAIAEGDFEKAYSYFNMKQAYDKLIRQAEDEGIDDSVKQGILKVKNNGFDWSNQVCHDSFIEAMEKVEEKGKLWKSCTYRSAVKQKEGWTLFYDGKLQSGETILIQFDMNAGGIEHYCVMKEFMVLDEKSGEFVEDREARKLNDELLEIYVEPQNNSVIQ